MKTVETGTNFQKNLYKSRFLLIDPTSLQKIQEKTFSPISFYETCWKNGIMLSHKIYMTQYLFHIYRQNY